MIHEKFSATFHNFDQINHYVRDHGDLFAVPATLLLQDPARLPVAAEGGGKDADTTHQALIHPPRWQQHTINHFFMHNISYF